jgi:septum site-determining protein MinC
MVQTSAQLVSIKGIRDGILISLGEGDFDDTIKELTEKLEAQTGFLSGSRIALSIGDRQMNNESLSLVNDLLAGHEMDLWAVLANKEVTRNVARDLGLATRLPGSQSDLEGNVVQRTREHSLDTDNLTTEKPGLPGQGYTAPQDRAIYANSLLLQETLRSGRSIYHEGHVVVIGDVNPGAEIIAGGNVVVWGKLRGLVHAGAHGDDSTMICALDLSPTQLRIADQIAISPGSKRRKPVPEQASIQDNRIVAEAWVIKR